MSVPKLLNENPKRYLAKLLGLRGNIENIPNTKVFVLPTKNLTYIKFLTILDKKLEYLKSKNLIDDEYIGVDYITFTLKSNCSVKNVCVSKKTGLEVFQK